MRWVQNDNGSRYDTSPGMELYAGQAALQSASSGASRLSSPAAGRVLPVVPHDRRPCRIPGGGAQRMWLLYGAGKSVSPSSGGAPANSAQPCNADQMRLSDGSSPARRQCEILSKAGTRLLSDGRVDLPVTSLLYTVSQCQGCRGCQGKCVRKGLADLSHRPTVVCVAAGPFETTAVEEATGSLQTIQVRGLSSRGDLEAAHG